VTSITNNDFNASVEIWRFFRQYTLNELTSSIAESTEVAELFSVYPNPIVSETVNVRFNVAGIKNVVVCNALGQSVYETITSATQLEIDHLTNAGLYFISVSVGSEVQTLKLIRN
jgi:polyhydroxybutyrate depolymerase